MDKRFKMSEQNFTEDLMKVMKPEIYKGYKISFVLDRFMIGLKSFDTLEKAKEWIDKLNDKK